MNREEILATNRKDNEGKPDERELQVLANASRIGMVVGGILSVVIILFSRIIDVPLLGLAAWSVYFSMAGSRSLYQFMKTKERFRLVQAVIGILLGLACLIGMIILGLQK